MYNSRRAALVRNVSVSLLNGGVTLIILLIAPLGLMAVIINTLLVTVATYTVTIAADWVMVFLQGGQRAELLSQPRQLQIRSRNVSKLNRR